MHPYRWFSLVDTHFKSIYGIVSSKGKPIHPYCNGYDPEHSSWGCDLNLFTPGLTTLRFGTSDQPFGLGCVSIYLLETTDSSFFFIFIEDDTKSPQPTCHYLGLFMVAWSLLTRCTSLHGVGFLNIGACPKLQLT